MPIDMSAATAPPKRGTRTPTARASASKTVAPPVASLAEQRFAGLNGLGQLGQMACTMGKQYAQAATFGMHWQPIARELAVLADTQPTIARYVDLVITAGPYAALIGAVTPFVMQTAANYGLIKAGTGTVPPAVLESQMKAAMARQEADALREQHQAVQDAENAQREYNAMVEQMKAKEQAALRDNVENNGWDPRLHDTAAVPV